MGGLTAVHPDGICVFDGQESEREIIGDRVSDGYARTMSVNDIDRTKTMMKRTIQSQNHRPLEHRDLQE